MSREQRIKLIKEIEEARQSRVLCYLTGDRRGRETRIGSDVFSFLYEHLVQIGPVENIDLFLYSTGGATMAGFGIVNLIREFCKKLSVLIPFKAHSAATLIALGADEIVMTRLGQLSPVDPSVTSPLNPSMRGPQDSRTLIPVSVEDVIGYLDLAKKEVKLEDEAHLAQVFQQLSAKVHPLALGSVYRAREQIGMLARNLLSLHIDIQREEEKIERIISILTKERYSHDYIIGRREAKDVIGLRVIDVPSSIEEKMSSLYSLYESAMELNTPFSHEAFLGKTDFKDGNLYRAFIESVSVTHVFRSREEIKRIKVQQPGVPIQEGIQERKISEGWTKIS